MKVINAVIQSLSIHRTVLYLTAFVLWDLLVLGYTAKREPLTYNFTDFASFEGFKELNANYIK